MRAVTVTPAELDAARAAYRRAARALPVGDSNADLCLWKALQAAAAARDVAEAELRDAHAASIYSA